MKSRGKRGTGMTALRVALMCLVLGGLIWATTSESAFAAEAVDAAVEVDQTESAAASEGFEKHEVTVWAICLIASIVALTQAFLFYKNMMKADEGNERMIEIAASVRQGSDAYLKQQYKVVIIFFVIIFLLLGLAALSGVQSNFVPFAFITGGFFSGLAGFFGMKTATWASSRTAAGAQKSLNAGLQVSFRSGAVMGLTVVGLGLLDITIWYAILRWGFNVELGPITVTMLCFGMGASAQALFARVGGGIFTKAADVGADLVGKVEQGIPEDDPRNPATIADNVGDNVGDVAGMGADLYESYCGSILATAALGVAAFVGDPGQQLEALFLPLLIAAVGIGLSIIGIYMVRSSDDASQKALLKALGKGINVSTVLVIVAAFACTQFIMSDHSGVAFSISVGLLAGWIIGKWTEYSTSDEYRPTQQIASQAQSGPATLIIDGVAEGMKSVWVPVMVVCVSTLLAFGFANGFEFKDVSQFTLGLYGVGIAAVGMLSTLGITLATDAYGPIADNAGGNAEMAGLEPIVRERTDALDSLGNTTAATGKGFAIGSAALTALALLAAYIEEVRMGFDHWAEAHIASTELSDGEASKVTDTFVVESHGEHHHSYLVFPSDKTNDEAWQNAESVTVTPIEGKEKEGLYTISGGGIDVDAVDVKTATLPDYARYYDASLMNPKILIGVFIGCMATFVFCAMTMKAVGRAANGMVEEVRRQFREKPGIMDGTEKPDYQEPVRISTAAAQKEMVLPSLLGLVTPIATGIILGVGGVLGLLVGTMTCGFCVAIFMSNAGGAWDNAKKYIEAGNFGGKGSDAHKAGVVGDTVGDPFKDTSGPSLNILIKLMSMVSVVAAGFVVRYSLVAMGVF